MRISFKAKLLITLAQTTLKKDEILTIYEWRYIRGCDDYPNM